MTGRLPDMDTLIELGDSRFTRRRLGEIYRPESDDDTIEAGLRLAVNCKRAFDAKVTDFIIPYYDMATIEVAAILYNDCLPEDHPLKGEFSKETVEAGLNAARIWYFYGSGNPPYI